MAEEIREIVLTVMVDTNKRTIQRTFALDELSDETVLEAVQSVRDQLD